MRSWYKQYNRQCLDYVYFKEDIDKIKFAYKISGIINFICKVDINNITGKDIDTFISKKILIKWNGPISSGPET